MHISIYILCLIEIEALLGSASSPYEQQGVPTTTARGRRKTLKENILLYMEVPIALLKLVCICTGRQRTPSTGAWSQLAQITFTTDLVPEIVSATDAESHTWQNLWITSSGHWQKFSYYGILHKPSLLVLGKLDYQCEGLRRV